MGENNESSNLPLLPGLTFPNVGKTSFHKCTHLEVSKGVGLVRHGVTTADTQASNFDCHNVFTMYKAAPTPAFQPHFVRYDSKCLTFKAFFTQTVTNSPTENLRVRHVNILYFLEDDSLTVTEPCTDNAGFAQGRLVRRGQIPMEGCNGRMIHWKDFNLGIKLKVHGFKFHIVNCDSYTREFLLSMGIELNEAVEPPADVYAEQRRQQSSAQPIQQRRPKSADKLRRFLQFSGQTLNFRAVWSDDNEDMSYFCIKYYLEDDTVEVGEIHHHSQGKDPFPLLLRRVRLPKADADHREVHQGQKASQGQGRSVHNTVVACEWSHSTEAVKQTEYYGPRDFLIGQSVEVFGRAMLLHQCSQSTRKYYSDVLNIQQPADFEVCKKAKSPATMSPPPHILPIGTLEDSLENCKHIILKSPRKDSLRHLLNANKFLRYYGKLNTTHRDDRLRNFIICYSLADSTISILEPAINNSGFVGGKFLSRTLVPKPGSNPNFPLYYGPNDFSIGAIVNVYGHKFEIIGADKMVYQYMEENPEKFTAEVLNNMREHMTKGDTEMSDEHCKLNAKPKAKFLQSDVPL